MPLRRDVCVCEISKEQSLIQSVVRGNEITGMSNRQIRLGINGFGRIGRLILRAISKGKYSNLKVVSVNSTGDPMTNAHLLKYDRTNGVLAASIETSNEFLIVNGSKIACLTNEEPSHIPWGDHDVDIVFECTGKFTSREKARGHLESSPRKVIISAPAKNEDITIVMGVNEADYDPQSHHIISNASCTTNCVAPLIKVLDDNFGVSAAMMTTIHAYTNDQQILDKRHKDLRRARAAGSNIIPTTTGAAKAVGTVIPNLEGKVHGMAFRVPTASVSVTDVVSNLNTPASVEEINSVYKTASNETMRGILDFNMEPLVSSDYRENPYSCIVDGLSTITLGTNMVKTVGWYDNEW